MNLLQRLGVRHPIFLAPMAGGPGTPELAAAVSRAGGLGAIGAAYMTADQITEAASRLVRPFHINLFAGGWNQDTAADTARMLEILGRVHATFGIDPPAVPNVGDDPFPAQLDAVMRVKPELFSFTFGIPADDDIRAVREAGVIIAGTATTAREVRLLADAGVDAIIVQGAEAGAHRGTFAERFEDAMVPLLDLLEQARCETSLPLIAAGGLMDGRDIAAVLRRGAVAASLGTAFLATPESGAAPAYKEALLHATSARSVITRAFSGRPARGLANEFHDMVDAASILPYPLQNALTRPMRNAAARRGEAGFMSLWAGTGVSRMRAMPAGDLVAQLVAEMQ